MTLTERNSKLQDLRKRLTWLRTEQLAVGQSIRDVNKEFFAQMMFNDTTLYDELFEDML